MTTIKQILDKFNSKHRYTDKVENTDIGDYTFNEAYIDDTGYMMEFIDTKNPDIWLKINDDRIIINLAKKIDENTVNVTSWVLGKKYNKEFPAERFKKIPSNRRRPFPTKD